MAALWTIALLRELRVIGAEHTVLRFRSRLIGSLLAYLAYHLETRQPRDLVADLLWPECDGDTSRLRFRVALNSLRRQLEPPGVPAGSVLLADRASVQLNPERVATDVGEFRTALRAAAAAGDPSARARALRAAVETYRGPLLPQLCDDWILVEQHQLEEQYFQAVEELITHLEEVGDLSGAIHTLRNAVGIDPLREEVRRRLMRLQAATGRAGDAVREYRSLERLLARDVGVLPSPATRALVRQIGNAVVREEEDQVQGGSLCPAPPHPALRPSPASPRPETGALTFLAAEGVPEREVAALVGAVHRHHGCEARAAPGGPFVAVFSRAADAVACAVVLQAARAETDALEGKGTGPSGEEREPGPAPSSAGREAARLRIALDTGAALFQEGEYGGPVLDRLAWIVSAVHPGQCLCADRTAVLVRGELPVGMRLTEVGVYRFRGFAEPQRLFQVDAGRERAVFPPPQAARAHGGHLPAPLTRFFGREPEIAQLVQLLTLALRGYLTPTRLLTLTGAGGSGKTRLAVEAGRKLEEAFPGSVWFVPLADLRDARLLIEVIRDALGVSRSPDRSAVEQITDILASRQVLLVLDNFEQLLTPSAPSSSGSLPTEDARRQPETTARDTLRDLLVRLPTLTCLVTSRQWLEVPGEHVFPLAPLPVPVEGLGIPQPHGPWPGLGTPVPPVPRTVGGAGDPGSEHPVCLNPELSTLHECPSVQLFVDRAQAIRPDFRLTMHNAGAVAGLCRRLEGLPLALELAASRVWLLSPARMLERLGERLDFLASRRPEGGGRHHTLRAVCDWSYRLLSSDLQRLFARLSVFRGGWTLEGAAAVCGGRGVGGSGGGSPAPTPTPPHDPTLSLLDALQSLGACSLVLVEHAPGGPRFQMLETLREFATEQLSPEERADLRRRHAEHCLALAESAGAAWNTPEASRWIHCFEGERENFRAALEWSLSEGRETKGEGRRAKDEGRNPDGGGRGGAFTLRPSDIGLRLAGALAWFWKARCTVTEGREWVAALLAASEGSAPVRAEALRAAGMLAWQQGDCPAVTAAYRESLVLSQEMQDASGIARCLSGLGMVALRQGDMAGARGLFEEVLAARRAAGIREGEASSLVQLGEVARRAGDLEGEAALYGDALQIYRELGRRWGEASCLQHLGHLTCDRGNPGRAAVLYAESLALFRQLEDRSQIAALLVDLAALVHHGVDDGSAQARLAESVAIHRELGNRRDLADALLLAGELAWMRHVDAAPLFEEAARLYRESSVPEREATALIRLAGTALHRTDPAEARVCWETGLALRKTDGEAGVAACLEILASFFRPDDRDRRAAARTVRLYSAAAALRETAAAPLSLRSLSEVERRLEGCRRVLGDAAFASAWEAGRSAAVPELIAQLLAADSLTIG